MTAIAATSADFQFREGRHRIVPAVLVFTGLLHLGLFLALNRSAGPAANQPRPRSSAPPSAHAVFTIIPAPSITPAAAAVTAAPPPAKTRRARPATPVAKSEAAAERRVETPPDPAAAAEPPLVASPAAPPAQAASLRRSRVFGRMASGGADAGQDYEQTAPPGRLPPAPLAAVMHEGLAHSVFAVAGPLASAGDGICEIKPPAAESDLPQISCSTSVLSQAAAGVTEPALWSLGKWLRVDPSARIRIELAQGQASFVILR